MSGTIGYTHAFQPIIDTDAGEILSYEVLLRGLQNESPAEVMNQVADECLMDFDQLSRKRAIELAARLGLDRGLSLNFTPRSIFHQEGIYVRDTIATAESHGIVANQLTLEITENEAIRAPQALLDVLGNLRRTGITIAIDDFGSGHAGLNLLVDVQPDLIKLDMHLIRGIHSHGAKQSVVRAICDVCVDLGIDVLAEGVETEEEFAFCKRLGISLHQGFLFAKPGFECLPSVANHYLLNGGDKRRQA